MATVNVRGAFQLFKADEPDATIQEFNSLTNEVALPYKILASEELLAASLALVESTEEYQQTYAVPTIHSAYTYLNQLSSYVPLMSRSQSAKKLAVNTELLQRLLALYSGTDRTLLDLVHKLVEDSDPASDNVSITDLSNLENAMAELEKRWRQDIKAKGGKVEQIRKAVVAASSGRKSGPPTQGRAGSDEDEEGTGTGASEDDDKGLGEGTRRRARERTVGEEEGDRAAGADDGGAGDSTEPALKGARWEQDAGGAPSVNGHAPAAAASRARRPAARKTGATATLVYGRLRGLTNGEKKAVAMLNQVIETLAHVYANKYNDLIPIFDTLLEKVQAVQSIINAERAAFEAKEDKKPPEPFHETTLEGVLAALADSTQTFRDDDECRYELDEDLLHPIAHACLTVINQIEGYRTPPYQQPTEEEKRKKQAARDLLKAKREEAARKVLERAKAREELAQRKEEEKRLLRARLGGGGINEDNLQEDSEIKNPVPMGYVHYERSLPLGSTELFEKALFVWSMLVSVPQPLLLSQMPFSLFVKGLLEEDQDANGLMEEITGCLLELVMEHVRVSSPATPRITTRGKNWFDALVEFVGVASGNKKRRQQQRQQRAPSTPTDDDEEDDSSELSSDDTDSSNSSSSGDSSSSHSEEQSQLVDRSQSVSEAAAKAEEGVKDDAAGEATPGADGEKKEVLDAAQDPSATPAVPAVEEEEVDTFGAELKATVERVTALRSLATWGNVDMIDRLNLLQFCVLEALASDKVIDEADKLFKQREEDANEVEKHVKEVREEAEKEMKAVLRRLSASSPASSPTTTRADRKLEADNDTLEEMKAQVLANADRKRKAVYAKFLSKQDGSDVGAIIQPIGMDRYKRLYWRFPLDRRVLVQTTSSTTANFPCVPEPEELRKRRMGGSLFLDDEQEEEAMLLSSNRRTKVTKDADSKAPRAPGEEEGEDAEKELADDTTQRSWGIVPGEYIARFAEGLDPRGEREAALRKALEEMSDYVANMEEPYDGRATRSRARTFGYLNRLKAYF